MATLVYVNFPVKDVAASTAFYEGLGFKRNPEFSNGDVSSMVWDDTFTVMLLNHAFYKRFIKDKEIIDAQKVSGALIAFNMESADAVEAFGDAALKLGGSVYHVDSGVPREVMFGLEVQDLDGNMLEPVWMAQ